MCEFRIQDGRHSPWRGLPQMAPWHHVGATMEITLDKNGSLYDPAGTESWNVQIRYETIKLTMHPTQQHDSLFNSSNWVLQVHIRTSPDASPENVGVFVGSDPTDSVTAPCIEFRIRKGEDKGRKRERSFTSIQMLHTHTLSYTEAFTHRSFWRVSLYDILWSWAQTVLFLTSSTWWHRALLQTFADISLVKYCHMCHLQHHGTDLFWAIYVGFSIIKWNNMCHTQHHGTELFWAISAGFSILKWNDMCHTRHHGTELFW